jgi:hypothetical protein
MSIPPTREGQMAESKQVQTREESAPPKGVRVKDGRLAVSELAADRAGGPSPFGDDQEFPLPVENLRYTHSTTP